MRQTMQDKPERRKPLHLKSFDYKGKDSVYFITICTADKQPHFLLSDMASMVIDELQHRRKALEISLFCYCIMPDHLHLLLSLDKGYHKSLQNWIAAFKRHTARTAKGLRGIKPLWQKNFHEHIIRKEESLLKTAEYILNNPVRRGLVQEWSNYRFCWMSDDLPLR